MARTTDKGYAASPLALSAPSDKWTVNRFLRTPSPTVLPMEEAQHKALPLPQHMVAGSPYPHSAQTKLAHWNRVTGGPGMPAGVTYNAPRSRMTQT